MQWCCGGGWCGLTQWHAACFCGKAGFVPTFAIRALCRSDIVYILGIPRYILWCVYRVVDIWKCREWEIRTVICTKDVAQVSRDGAQDVLLTNIARAIWGSLSSFSQKLRSMYNNWLRSLQVLPTFGPVTLQWTVTGIEGVHISELCYIFNTCLLWLSCHHSFKPYRYYTDDTWSRH